MFKKIQDECGFFSSDGTMFGCGSGASGFVPTPTSAVSLRGLFNRMTYNRIRLNLKGDQSDASLLKVLFNRE